MSGARSLTNDVDMDIKGLFSAIWRKKWLILLLSLIGGAIIFAAVSSISPRYRSDAQILIKKRESIFTRVRDDQSQQSGGEFDEQAIGSQVAIINSDDLAIAVIKKLDLEKVPEFNESASSSGFMELVKGIISPGRDNPPLSASDGERAVVDPAILKKFKERLTVYSAEKSRVVVIEFWSNNPQLARDVPNALAELYIESTKNATLESDENATTFLEPEIAQLREEVRKAEEAVASERSNSDILLGSNNALLATQQLSEVSSELSRVRAESSAAEAKVDSIRTALNNGGSLDVIAEVISSPLIQRLKEREVSLQSDIAQLSTTLLPNHPRIKALNAQLPDVSKQIRIAANNILKSLENNVLLARKKETTLLQEVNRLKAESSRVGEAEVKLRTLEREAAVQRERLEGYLSRFNEARSRQDGGYAPSEARIIEHANIPADAYFPKVLPFTIAGTTATALLTIVGLLAAELLSGRAFKPMAPMLPEDMSLPLTVEIANAPALAPQLNDLLRDEQMQQEIPSHIANDRDVFGIEFAKQAIEALGKSVVAVVSSGGSAGSPSSWNIAHYLSAKGHSVVICDVTGEGDTAAKLLGQRQLPGLFEVLYGKASLREVLYRDTSSSAHVLASGNVNADQVADAGKLQQVVETLKHSYDFVVFDCGDTGVDGISRVADADSIIVLPIEGSSLADCKMLERKIRNAGFIETILIRSQPDSAKASSAA